MSLALPLTFLAPSKDTWECPIMPQDCGMGAGWLHTLPLGPRVLTGLLEVPHEGPGFAPSLNSPANALPHRWPVTFLWVPRHMGQRAPD